MNNDIQILIIAEVAIIIIGIVLGLLLKGICEASGWKDGSYK